MPRYRQKGLFQIGQYWIDRRHGSPALYRFWYDRERKRVTYRSLGTTDLREATQKLTDWFVRNQRPNRAEPEDVSLAAVLLNYYHDHASKIASAEQARVACSHLSAFFGQESVSGLTVQSQEAYVAHRLDSVKVGTVSRELSVARAALNWAHRRQEIATVPHVLDPGKGPPRERRLSMDEMRALLDNADLHVWHFAMLAGATLGRPEAILELTLFQCDQEHRLIALNPAGRKQTKKYRPVVPMTETARRVILQCPGPHLVQYRGRPVKSIKTGFRRARERAALGPDVTPYTIRHTMATELRSRGVPMDEIAGMLGHKTGGVTEVYAKYAPDFRGAAAREIDSYFEGLFGSFAAVAPKRGG